MFPNQPRQEPLPPATLPALPLQPGMTPGTAPAGIPGPGVAPDMPGAGIVPGVPAAAPLPGVPTPGFPGVSGTPTPVGAVPGNPLQPVAATGAVPAPVQPGTTSTEQVVERAKQLVGQQGQSPYQLADSFAQLKSDYLARQYHITSSNSAGS